MKDTNEIFKTKAEKLGWSVEKYSGRGMFGRECYGVVVNSVEDFIAEMGMKGLKVDNMGLKYIVYTGVALKNQIKIGLEKEQKLKEFDRKENIN